MLSAILSAPGQQRAGAAARPKESTWAGTEERGQQTARAGRYARRIGAQLQRQPSHDFTACRMLLRHRTRGPSPELGRGD
jgi:hypothetical protein